METVDSIKVRVGIGALIIAGLAVVFVITRHVTPLPPLPTTSLTFLGRTNLRPIGIMTAFSISNGSPSRLLYDPVTVEYRTSNEWVAVPSASIVNRVGIVAPGQAYVFFVPGAVTNHSLRIKMVCREHAGTERLLFKEESFVRKISGGKTDAWLGKRYGGTLNETTK